MSSYPPHYAYPSAPPLFRTLPSPPRLHWGWVLGLTIVTFGIFASIWLLVQSIWIRKMRGKSAGFVWAICNLCLLPALFIAGAIVGVVVALRGPSSMQAASNLMGSIGRILGLVFYLGTVYTMRSELEAEPIGIPLGGVMTFLFSVYYFQYHLRDYGMSYGGLTGTLGLSTSSISEPIGHTVPNQYLPDTPPTNEN